MMVLECEGPDPVLASWRCWHRLMEDRVTVAEGWQLVVKVTRRLDKFIATATLEATEAHEFLGALEKPWLDRDCCRICGVNKGSHR